MEVDTNIENSASDMHDRFLCLLYAGAASVNADPFGEGDLNRLLDSVNCMGNESSIMDCETIVFSGKNCPTAGVVCQGAFS